MKNIGEIEEKYIRENYEKMTLSQMARDLGFSRQAVTNTAIKLGIKKDTKKSSVNMTDEELKMLYDLRLQRFNYFEIAATIKEVFGKDISQRTLKNRWNNRDIEEGIYHKGFSTKVLVTENDMKDAEKYRKHINDIKSEIDAGDKVMSIIRAVSEDTNRPIKKKMWYTVIKKYANQVLVTDGKFKECLMYTDICEVERR